MKILFPVMVAYAGFVALAGCTQQEAADQLDHLGTTTVATVNGRAVHESVFRLYAINRVQKSADDLSSEEREAVLNEIVQMYLLAEDAERIGIDEERTTAAQLELQRLNALARSALERYRQENEATELEMRETYEASLEELGATEYKARHILLKTEPEAEAVIGELRGGADFAELARERSTGPTGPKGGDLGWFDANTMVPPFANAVRSMTTGTFSETPVETRFGWHVILLEDVRENEPPELDAVRDRMKATVEQRKIEAYVASLKDDAKIEFTRSTIVGDLEKAD